jgi:hypothetical protein
MYTVLFSVEIQDGHQMNGMFAKLYFSKKKSCCPGSIVYIVVPTYVHMYILIVSNRENRSELTDKIPPGYTYVGWQIKINTHAKIEKLQEWLLS